MGMYSKTYLKNRICVAMGGRIAEEILNGKDFVTILVMLRKMLTAEGYGHVKIFGPETMTSHMYEGGTGSYVKAILESPPALKAIDVFATHGYEDGVKAEMSATTSGRFWKLIEKTGKEEVQAAYAANLAAGEVIKEIGTAHTSVSALTEALADLPEPQIEVVEGNR